MPDARHPALDDRPQDADRRVEACRRITDARLDPHRRPIGRAGEAHHTAHRLGDHLEALVVGVRPLAAEAFDGRGDDARVDLRERVVAEPEALHRARAEVLDDHVGRLRQRLEHLAAARRLEVERHALLVEVHETEEDRVHAGLLGEPVARRLACRRLDLDHLGAQPRQRLSAARPRLVKGKIEDPDSLECRAHRPLPSLSSASSRTPSRTHRP